MMDLANLYRLWCFLPDGRVPAVAKKSLLTPLLRSHFTKELANGIAFYIVPFLKDDGDFLPLLQLFLEQQDTAADTVCQKMMECIGFQNTNFADATQDTASDIQLRWFIFDKEFALDRKAFETTTNVEVWWQYITRLRKLEWARTIPQIVQFHLVQDKQRLIYLILAYHYLAFDFYQAAPLDLQQDMDVCLAAMTADPSRFSHLFEKCQPDVDAVAQMIERNPYTQWEFCLPRPYFFQHHIVMMLHHYNDFRFAPSLFVRESTTDIFEGHYDDAYIMSFALTLHHNVNIRNLSKRLCGDANFMLHLLTLGLDSLEFVSADLLKDRDFLLAACGRIQTSQYNSSALLYRQIIDGFADDFEMVHAAMANNIHTLLYQHISARLKANDDIVKLALKMVPQNLAFVPARYQSDPVVVMNVIQKNGELLKDAAPYLQRHPDYIMAASKTYADVLFWKLPRRLHVASFLLQALENRRSFDISADLIAHCMQYFDVESEDDTYARLAKLLLYTYPSIPIATLPSRFQNDVDFVVAYCFRVVDIAFLAAQWRYFNETRFHRLYIRSDMFALWKSTAMRCRYFEDIEMMAMSVSEWPASILWAPEHLMKPILEFAAKEYSVHVSVFDYLPPSLHDDKALTLHFVQLDGSKLQRVSKRLQGDLDICIAALTSDPHRAYPHVACTLRSHPYIKELMHLVTEEI